MANNPVKISDLPKLSKEQLFSYDLLIPASRINPDGSGGTITTYAINSSYIIDIEKQQDYRLTYLENIANEHAQQINDLDQTIITYSGTINSITYTVASLHNSVFACICS